MPHGPPCGWRAGGPSGPRDGPGPAYEWREVLGSPAWCVRGAAELRELLDASDGLLKAGGTEQAIFY